MLTICERHDRQVRRVRTTPTGGDDMDWIAEGLSSVGFFLEPCLQGREPAEQAIELFFRRYDKAHTPVLERALGFDGGAVRRGAQERRAAVADAGRGADCAAAAAGSEPAAAPAPQAGPAEQPRPAVDAELLAIFLEEAGEVLATIEARAARRAARSRRTCEALTVIRRGFHTLKGSGRMVGLMDLGEVAWEIEQVMNLLAASRSARHRRPCST